MRAVAVSGDNAIARSSTGLGECWGAVYSLAVEHRAFCVPRLYTYEYTYTREKDVNSLDNFAVVAILGLRVYFMAKGGGA